MQIPHAMYTTLWFVTLHSTLRHQLISIEIFNYAEVVHSHSTPMLRGEFPFKLPCSGVFWVDTTRMPIVSWKKDKYCGIPAVIRDLEVVSTSETAVSVRSFRSDIRK